MGHNRRLKSSLNLHIPVCKKEEGHYERNISLSPFKAISQKLHIWLSFIPCWLKSSHTPTPGVSATHLLNNQVFCSKDEEGSGLLHPFLISQLPTTSSQKLWLISFLSLKKWVCMFVCVCICVFIDIYMLMLFYFVYINIMGVYHRDCFAQLFSFNDIFWRSFHIL